MARHCNHFNKLLKCIYMHRHTASIHSSITRRNITPHRPLCQIRHCSTDERMNTSRFSFLTQRRIRSKFKQDVLIMNAIYDSIRDANVHLHWTCRNLHVCNRQTKPIVQCISLDNNKAHFQQWHLDFLHPYEIKKYPYSLCEID